jgi:hypothetical protein
MTLDRRTTIDFDALLAGLEQPLELLGDTPRRQELEAYVNAARPHVERAAFDVVSQAVTAFNDVSPEMRARLEYSGGSLHLAFDPPAEREPPETAFSDDLERVTLRLPKELKDIIDRVAGSAAMSANNWYVRELSRTISRHVDESVRQAWREHREARRAQRNAASHQPDRDAESERETRRRGFNRGRGGSLKGFVGGQ